ncbi:MAG: insulinase family protein, partial [Acidobacteriota bacterium]|nr:insulinase family protein [Acidobacteriota bacterium]
YVNILTQTKDAELGYALDSKYYGIPNYTDYMKANLAKLTLADVNNAIKTHLASNKMRVVLVTKDAEGLRDEIVKNKPGTVSYASPKPAEVTNEDKIISTFRIPVTAQDVTITPVERVFE